LSTATHKNRKRASTKQKGAAPRRSANSALQAKIASSRSRRPQRRRRGGLSAGMKTTLAVGLAFVALAAIFYLERPHHASGPGQFKFAVGNPGPGQDAPPIKLSSTTGGTFDLSSMQGKTVLLYFQEGLMCQPCWDQLKDIESNMAQFRALGINELVSITTDPLDQLKQKSSDMGLSSPVLSDPNLKVSESYSANQYGMMGSSRDGHTFIAVGPDGKILWRADYGGSPDYTMYLPIPNLVADVRAGLGGTSS
jgi:peroxiredoxin